MPKKSAQWITIPEVSLHTPVSGVAKEPKPKAGGNPDLVKNKLLWGVGFVVVLVAAFAVLAPTQFSKLLQGNVLFDTSGISGEQPSVISPLNLLPQQTAGTTKSSETATPPAGNEIPSAIPTEGQTPSTSSTAENPEASSQSLGTNQETLNPAAPSEPSSSTVTSQAAPVVQPQERPVNVAVEPIATPEPVVVAPIVTGPVDCKSDMTCLLPKLVDCSLAKGLFAYQAMGQSVEASLEITGAEGDNCLVKAVIAKAPMTDLVGKDGVCKLAKGVYTQESLQALFNDASKLSEVCSGSAMDALKGYLGTQPSTTGQEDLVAQLKRQVEELQAQKDQSNKLMQDLVNEVQAQKTGGVYPAATTSTIGVGTGTANTVQPGFRTNPYRVTVTPEQMLQQRLAGVSVSAYGATGATSYSNVANAQGYQAANIQGMPSSYYQNVPTSTSGTLVKEGKTPQTGPEATAIALFAAFVALVSWRFMRMFAK